MRNEKMFCKCQIFLLACIHVLYTIIHGMIAYPQMIWKATKPKTTTLESKNEKKKLNQKTDANEWINALQEHSKWMKNKWPCVFFFCVRLENQDRRSNKRILVAATKVAAIRILFAPVVRPIRKQLLNGWNLNWKPDQNCVNQHNNNNSNNKLSMFSNI